MLNNVVNRLYKLSEAFGIVGNQKVKEELELCCDIIDDEIQRYEHELEKQTQSKWTTETPTETGYYLWKELGSNVYDMSRTVVKIKANGLEKKLYISFNEYDNELIKGEIFHKLEIVAEREWLKVGEL